jgi:peroxiredoxin
MKRVNLLIIFAILAAAAIVPVSRARDISAGTALEDFTLSDINGKDRSFNDLKGKNGAVIIFLSAQCPVVRGYVDRINSLAADYQAKGINFIGVNSNAGESLDWVRSNAAEYGFKFPVLIDKGNVLADRLGANVTPEAYYFDAKNVLMYRGAIDNDRSGRNVSETFLKTAFDAGLSGKKIEKTSANEYGCSIKRVGDQ